MHPNAAVPPNVEHLRVDGLHVEVAGSGGPTVALVHAGITDSRMWNREFSWLAQKHRVVRYDVRGFGQSDLPKADYSDDEDLLAVLDAVGADDAILIGSSNGGRIAIDFAVVHPDRVSGLLLMGAGLGGLPTGPALRAGWQAEDAALERGDFDQARDINLDLWLTGVGRSAADVDGHATAALSQWLDDLLPRQMAWEGEARDIDPPALERLASIAVPVAVVVGEHDQAKMHHVAGVLHGAIPDTTLEVVGGAAHLVNVEQPEAFEASLTAFLARVE